MPRSTGSHQVATTARFTVNPPNMLDLKLTVRGYTHYPDYELLCSNYFHPDLMGSVFVINWDGGDSEKTELISVSANPVYCGMYNFFPRDEFAAHIMTDGRGQRGRWPWHIASGRPYAYPLALAKGGGTRLAYMGRSQDVSSVGVTINPWPTHMTVSRLIMPSICLSLAGICSQAMPGGPI